MEKFNSILADASVFIAKYRGQDPAFQQHHTDIFIELISKHPLKILLIKRVFDEIGNKYASLILSVNELLEKLKSEGKFELIQNDSLTKNVDEILKIKHDAINDDIDLSFSDSAPL